MRKAVILAAAIAPLCACQPHPGSGEGSAARGQPTEEAAYHPPPRILAVERLPGGAVVLSGQADAGARVRLASPDGVLTPAVVDGRGAWRARVASNGELRLFGLAAVEQGRTVQSEGYIAVTPNGDVAQLRAGAGAYVLAGRGGLRLLALDFDRKGGAILSGMGPPGAAVTVLSDDATRAHGAVDADGRFALTFDAPIAEGVHHLMASDSFGRAEATAHLTSPAPLTSGPYRAVREAGDWRIDWLTPGGGVQTTMLILPMETPA